MYKALDLAKYIVSKCTRDNMPITNLYLQKILYYIQKELLKQDKLAFNDEFEAWIFGPAITEVYYYFCGYGAMEINTIYDVCISDPIIDIIVETKRQLEPWDMVNEVHQKDGSWCKIYQDGIGIRNIIPRTLINSDR